MTRINTDRRESVYLFFHFYISVPHWRKSGQGLSEETCRQELAQRLWRNAAYWLIPRGLFSWLSYNTWGYQLRKYTTGLSTRQSGRSIFLNGGFRFRNDTSFCQVHIQLASTVELIHLKFTATHWGRHFYHLLMKSERSWSRWAGVTSRLHRAGNPFRYSDLELNILSDALVMVRTSERTHKN